MKKVKAKYQLDPYWKFSHEVKGAIWSEEKGKWELKVQHGDTTFDDECDVFIQATGNLK
jgi:cation diffusion facilitator CzcD-associated flavoprotein CzcO